MHARTWRMISGKIIVYYSATVSSSTMKLAHLVDLVLRSVVESVKNRFCMYIS
jgi:hypothetical protein